MSKSYMVPFPLRSGETAYIDIGNISEVITDGNGCVVVMQHGYRYELDCPTDSVTELLSVRERPQ